MKTSNKMRAAVLLGLMLGMTTGVYAAKTPDVTATSEAEFLNFNGSQGVAVASGEASVVYGDSTIECSTLPNSMTYVTNNETTNIGPYGIGAFVRSGDDTVGITFEGKVLNINPALASPLGRSWDTVTKNGIYAGGAYGGTATVSIKATELNITATTPSVTDPLDTMGQWAQILHSNAGIETGTGYGHAGGTINIDLQGGDLNIKNMKAGIGAHLTDSAITVTNAKDINITSDTAKTGAVLVSNDTAQGVFNNVGIASVGGKVDVSCSGDLTIENYGFGIVQNNPVEGVPLKVNVGGDIVLKGTNTNGLYSPLDGGNSERAASVGIYSRGVYSSEVLDVGTNVDVTVGGSISVEGYQLALASNNNGANVKVQAQGDITLKALTAEYGYGIFSNGGATNGSRRICGDIELTSETGKIYVEGSDTGIRHGNGGSDTGGNIVINGDSEIRGVENGIQSGTSGGAEIIFNGHTKVIATDGIGISTHDLGVFEFNGNLEVNAKDGIQAGEITVTGDTKITSSQNGLITYKLFDVGSGKSLYKGNLVIAADKNGILSNSISNIISGQTLQIEGKTIIDAGQIGIKTYKTTGYKSTTASYGKILTKLGGATDNAPVELLGGVDITAEVSAIDALGGKVEITGATKIDAPAALIARDGVYSKTVINQGEIDIDLDNQGTDNSIRGNIVADEGGTINVVNAKNLQIEGDVLAANKFSGRTNFSTLAPLPANSYTGDMSNPDTSTISIELGAGSKLTGVVDNFTDLASDNHTAFDSAVCAVSFDSSYDANGKEISTKPITSAGIVNLALSDGAEWQVTGDSSITSLALNGGVVDLLADGKQTLNIDTLSGGKGLFKMRLDADNEGNSDLVNVTTTAGAAPLLLGARPDSDADSGYLVQFEDLKDTVAAMNAAGKTRSLFATTNVAALRFASRAVEDTGIYDYNYDVEREDNGNSYDWYLTNEGTRSVSSIGKFVQQAAKAGYANIAGLDTYAARANALRSQEGGEGLWAQVDRSKLASDGSYAATVNRYRLGYDNTTKHGEAVTRTGVAISYGDGKTTLDGLLSRGDTESKTVELYNTRLYNNGAYRDLVIGYGSYDGEYDLTGSKTGNLFAADINNKAFKASVEYGKKNLTGGWFVEPQVQLQYARVLDSDYRIGDTSVATDAMDSFLARAGLRIGKDLGKSGSLYVKADVLHEFLGDQNLMATDDTGIMATTINNDGTWCNIGVGTAVALGRAALQLDAVKSFGNDMSDSWKLSANLQWSF